MKTSRVVFLVIAATIAISIFLLGAGTCAKFSDNNYEDFYAAFDFSLLTLFKIYAGTLAAALLISPIAVVVKLVMMADDKQKQEDRDKEKLMKKWQEAMSKENRE